MPETNEEKKHKILLIEDDKLIAKAYGDGFRRAGFDMRVASDGVEGLEMAREETPELILLDIIMPLMTGFETLSYLKKDNKLKDVPVIMLSNLGQKPDIEKAKNLGAVDYLVKSNNSMFNVLRKVKEVFGMEDE